MEQGCEINDMELSPTPTMQMEPNLFPRSYNYLEPKNENAPGGPGASCCVPSMNDSLEVEVLYPA